MAKFISNNASHGNIETLLKDSNERFGRLIKNLGVSNRKGTDRYNFEVDFSYAVNEIQNCPVYMQGKMFDRASNVISNLINYLKSQKDGESEIDATATAL